MSYICYSIITIAN